MADNQFKPLELVHLSPDSINLTGEFAVMTLDGTDVHFMRGIERARQVKRQRMQANRGVRYGIFEMRGAWDWVQILELGDLATKEFMD